MHVEPIVTELESRVRAQAGLMGGPESEGTVGLLLEVLGPAVKQAALSLAEQAVEEIRGQLSDHTVTLSIVDGDPVIEIRENESSARRGNEEDFDARISLRLPPSLKDAIENFATDNGESVNAWVVKALEGKAQRRPRGGRVNTSFEL